MACPKEEQATFIREARLKIDLAELGIGALKSRKGLTGALILEVPGAGSAGKVDTLVARLQHIAEEKGEGFRVQRSVKMTTLRLKGLESSLTADEMAAALATTVGEGVPRSWLRAPSGRHPKMDAPLS